jgi:prepilin signal peptidase PulO-like enzyme (type II secretory pathway)
VREASLLAESVAAAESPAAAVRGSAGSSESAPQAASTPAEGPLLRSKIVVMPVVVGVIVLAFATFPLNRAVLTAFTAAVLVVLSAIDIERRVIPNRIVLPAAGIVMVLQIALFTSDALESALAAILVALVLMIPQFFNRSWMGMGDVKLTLLIGAALGWGVVGAVLLGFLCTLPVALWVLIRGGLGARRTMIPFGPFLSLGALIVMFGPTLAGLPTN